MHAFALYTFVRSPQPKQWCCSPFTEPCPSKVMPPMFVNCWSKLRQRHWMTIICQRAITIRRVQIQTFRLRPWKSYRIVSVLPPFHMRRECVCECVYLITQLFNILSWFRPRRDVAVSLSNIYKIINWKYDSNETDIIPPSHLCWGLVLNVCISTFENWTFN